jgi:hypothetical protein
MWNFGGAKTQQIGIMRWAMRYIKPEIEEQRPFEQKLIALPGDT